MEKKDILIFAVVLVFAAIRLYMKYGNNNQSKKSTPGSTGSDLISPEQDNDYEPYSGK